MSSTRGYLRTTSSLVLLIVAASVLSRLSGVVEVASSGQIESDKTPSSKQTKIIDFDSPLPQLEIQRSQPPQVIMPLVYAKGASAGPLCGGVNCADGQTCLRCGLQNICTQPGATCCGSGGYCLASQECISCVGTGAQCRPKGSQCCGGGHCVPGQQCMNCGGGGLNCAPAGSTCCGYGFCPPGQRCLAGNRCG